MNEGQARGWLEENFTKGHLDQLSEYCRLLTDESTRQNLIAKSTLATIWSRHIVDSAQLLQFAPAGWQHWVDIGSGAGLPGIVIAIVTGKPVTLIEPRRLRVDFLMTCVQDLELAATVIQSTAETASVPRIADVVSARAVAPLDTIFASSRHFANASTTYILPKGAHAESDLAVARRSWQGMFHVKQSIVEPHSGIVVATDVAPR